MLILTGQLADSNHRIATAEAPNQGIAPQYGAKPDADPGAKREKRALYGISLLGFIEISREIRPDFLKHVFSDQWHHSGETI